MSFKGLVPGFNDKLYIPVEKMSKKQYLKGIKQGLWGGKAKPKILKMIKDNPDNPLV